MLALAAHSGVPAHRIGTVTPADDGITIRTGSRELRAPAARLARAYHDAIPSRMRAPATAAV
jgi:hypothetical protein